MVTVVPVQTGLALWLAILVNDKFLKGKGLFRTAFYFPSVTSSIAITTVFIFLFSTSGVVNRVLSVFGIAGPNWLYDQNGVITSILGALGVHTAPSWANFQILGVSVWSWLSGPSFGMCVIIILAIWTTSGTFMLLFLAALQNVSEEVEEASEIDGATPWLRFRHVTLPMLRPVVVLVATLGFIGTWQVFDQSYLTGPNNPTMVTPAFLAYQVSFSNFAFGEGAAIAFILFAFIVLLTLLQRKFVQGGSHQMSRRVPLPAAAPDLLRAAHLLCPALYSAVPDSDGELLQDRPRRHCERTFARSAPPDGLGLERDSRDQQHRGHRLSSLAVQQRFRRHPDHPRPSLP